MKQKRGSNDYDRILRENFLEPSIGLLKKILKVKSVQALPLPTKMQRTLEVEADGFYLVTEETGEKYIVHIEWQTTNDPEMISRMLLYHALNYRIHKLPVKSFVIYIGEDRLNMKNQLEHFGLNYTYDLISLADINPEEFLSSSAPEDVILAILAGKTRGEEKREIVQKVLVKLQLLLNNDEAGLKRRLKQLEVLGKLRDIQELIIKEKQNMRFVDAVIEELNYKREKRERIAPGMDQITYEYRMRFVEKLLHENVFTVEKIAELAEVSIDFVLNVKKQLTLE